MAVIRQFKAIRPTPEMAEKVAALPYDVVNSEEAAEMVIGNPYSFLHVDKAEIDLPAGTDIYSPEVYEKAKSNLEKMITDGVLVKDEKPMLYVYELTMDGRSQTGLVACTSIDEYMQGIIMSLQGKIRNRTEYATLIYATPIQAPFSWPIEPLMKYLKLLIM